MHTIVNINTQARADVADPIAAFGTTHPWADGWRVPSPLAIVPNDAAPPVVVAAAGSRTVTVEAVERIEGQIDAMAALDAKHGTRRRQWAPAATVYALGMRVDPLGDDNLRRYRDDFNSKPHPFAAIDKIIGRIEGEERTDAPPTTLGEVVITDEGHLSIGGDALPMTERAFGGVLAQCPPEVRTWLAGFRSPVAPPEELARQWRRAVDDKLIDVEKSVVFGGRNANGNPANGGEWYRCVSHGYATGTDAQGVEHGQDAVKVLRSVRRKLEGLPGVDGWRVESMYNPETSGLEVTFLRHAQEIRNLAAGDAFKGGWTLRTNDAGAGGIGTRHDVWRNLCMNLLIIAHEKIGKSKGIAHRKSGTLDERVSKLIDDTIADSVALLTGFGGDWGFATSTKIAEHPLFRGADTSTEEGMRKVMDTVAGLRSMKGTDVARDTAVEVLMGGWLMEPGDTTDALVNAVTRAHARVSIEALPRWEQAGGLLLKQLVATA